MKGNPDSGNRSLAFLGIPLIPLFILAVVFLAIRLPLLAHLPFIQDEAIYSMMIEGQRDGFTQVPTFLGYPVSWKMAPFFWTYAFLTDFTRGFGLEASYRIPSLFFGFLCILPLYLILRHFSDDNRALLAGILFLVPFVSVYPSISLLIDSPAMLLILLSLYFYIVRESPMAGGALAALAFTFKLVTAFISPVLAIAYFVICGKPGAVRTRSFLASLSLPILAAILNYLLLSPFGGGQQVYFEELLPRLLSSGADMGPATRLSMSADTLAYSMGPVFLLGLYGVARKWRAHPFMASWFSLTVLPFPASTMYPWYYLPVLPAIAFFAVAGIFDAKSGFRGNLPALAVLGAACLLSIFLVFGAYSALYRLHMPEKDVGLALSGRSNVQIIGHFKPGLLAYKELTERQSGGLPLDYGLVLGPPSFGGEDAAAFIRNYRTSDVPAINGSFSAMYTLPAVFRKDTNISSFDYVVLAGDLGFMLNGPEVLAESGDIIAYRRPGAP